MVFGIPHFKTTTLNSCFMLFSQQNMVVFAALGGLCTDGSQQPHHSSGFDHQNKMWTIQWREKGKRREREGKNTHGNYVCIYIITIYTLCVHRMKTDTYKAQKLPKKQIIRQNTNTRHTFILIVQSWRSSDIKCARTRRWKQQTWDWLLYLYISLYINIYHIIYLVGGTPTPLKPSEK